MGGKKSDLDHFCLQCERSQIRATPYWLSADTEILNHFVESHCRGTVTHVLKAKQRCVCDPSNGRQTITLIPVCHVLRSPHITSSGINLVCQYNLQTIQQQL